jgi:hypothetical protein
MPRADLWDIGLGHKFMAGSEFIRETVMAKCPFAVWKPFDGSPGGYSGGHPFKIVHHTTEGSSADGAFLEYRNSRNIPHFTVDDMTIYQHVDTEEAASALRHPTGTTETNRSSAVQIELVGFAGRPKSAASLQNLARLCRWIEAEHQVPSVWPNGPPKPAVNGQDPGDHNRNQQNWDGLGGHYGHCHVPNNVHWDPAYTEAELAGVMGQAPFPHIDHPGAGTLVMDDHAASGHHIADRVKETCEACFDAHANDCSGFARAVANQLGVQLQGLANEIVDTIRGGNGWTPLRDGAAAANSAAAGKLVIGGLKGSEQTEPDAHGHVVVVVAGPLDPTHNAYPKAYWGRLGGVGAKNQWTNWAWRAGDRDRVSYAEHDI